MNICVSACLLGLCTKYDGGHNMCDELLKLKEKHTLVPVCPEQMGGLSTPREPSEIVSGSSEETRVLTKSGKDVSREFIHGASIALQVFMLCRCEIAILKARSPSCGSGTIYNGSFTGSKTSGDGVFAKMLKEKGILVYTEEELNSLEIQEV
ncbi:MAG: DUF523 domain-containing protein [Christensenellales bacterium]